jgi:hypothetical protein
MAESFKDKLEQTGHKISETATQVGHRVGEAVEETTDWAKQKMHQAGNRVEELTEKAQHKIEEWTPDSDASVIKEHMDVIGSCGNKLGRVDHVEGSTIKLTRSDSEDGQHHRIPLSWISRVDSHVHLSKDCVAAKRDWQPA